MKKFVSCLSFSLIFCISAFSQIVTKEDLSEKEKKIYNEARKAAQSGDLTKSNNKYEDLLKLKPDFMEGLLRLATNYYNQKNLEKSEHLFNLAIDRAPEYDPEMYFSLASVQNEMKKYVEAADNYNEYVLKGKQNTEKIRKAIKLRDNLRFKDFAIHHPVPFNPVRLGPGINTRYSEYSPSLAIDGSSMIFTRNTGQEDFYISIADSMSGFKNAFPLLNLNTNQNEGAHAISADGKFMVFTACDRRDAFGSCDLYYAMYRDGKWTLPVNMGHTVNSAAWDSQPTLTADGRTLIFSSRRLGTIGGADLWMTWRDEKDAWVEPVNLGPLVNSSDDDESPYLHADGQTLYFRSDGHPGMGDFDIFFSRKNEIADTWEKPINIGYPINTEGQEGALVVSLDGEIAYFASDNDFTTHKSTGNLDIFSFALHEGAKPRASTFLKGYVTDAITGLPLKAKVTIKELSTGKNSFTLSTDKDGYFISGISIGKNYACIVEKKDYKYFAHNFDLTQVAALHKPYMLHIGLLPVIKIKESPESQPVVLQNIFFHSGMAELLPESDTEIELLKDMLNSYPELNIKITGHTDNVGNEDDNLVLSQRRASAVSAALIVKGISASRIIPDGKGESVPIADNNTEEGRQKNRRTEFVLMKIP